MMMLRLIRENVARPTRQIQGPEDVYSVMRFMEKEDREKFYALHLDAKNNILAMELIAIGTLTSTPIHPREVFKAAILNNSCSIICVHNHPSGDATPSLADKNITAILKKAGEILQVPIMDHVIIGHGGYCRVTPEEESNEREQYLMCQPSAAKVRKTGKGRLINKRRKTKSA